MPKNGTRIAFMLWFATVSMTWAGTVTNTEKGNSDMKISFEKRLSTNGSTRATAYSMSNKIITVKEKGKIFVSWLDLVSDIQIATYDLNAKTWSPPVLLGKGEDNHSGPALTMDSQGYLYAIFGPHHGPFQLRRSSKPFDARKWEPAQRFAHKATYPSLVCDGNDTLHLTYRGEDRVSQERGGGWWLVYQRRVKGGAWSTPRALFKPRKPFKYTQFGNALAVSKDGTLHLGFHVYAGDPLDALGTHLGYLRSRDNGETWESAQAAKIKLPATQSSNCFIEKGPSKNMRVGNLVVDLNGRPWLTGVHLEKGNSTALLWHLEGETWQSRDLGKFIQKDFPGQSLCGATLTFDRNGTLYVMGAINSNKEKPWGDPTQEIVLLTSSDEGKSFSVIPISKPDAKTPNWLPSIERPHGIEPIGIPSLLFTSGDKGQFGKNKEGSPTKVYFVKLEQISK